MINRFEYNRGTLEIIKLMLGSMNQGIESLEQYGLFKTCEDHPEGHHDMWVANAVFSVTRTKNPGQYRINIDLKKMRKEAVQFVWTNGTNTFEIPVVRDMLKESVHQIDVALLDRLVKRGEAWFNDRLVHTTESLTVYVKYWGSWEFEHTKRDFTKLVMRVKHEAAYNTFDAWLLNQTVDNFQLMVELAVEQTQLTKQPTKVYAFTSSPEEGTEITVTESHHNYFILSVELARESSTIQLPCCPVQRTERLTALAETLKDKLDVDPASTEPMFRSLWDTFRMAKTRMGTFTPTDNPDEMKFAINPDIVPFYHYEPIIVNVAKD